MREEAESHKRESLMGVVFDSVGKLISRYLMKEAEGYEPFTPSNPKGLIAAATPGDVLLIEGNTHIAGVIKYLTQSTWSHAALVVPPIPGRMEPDGEPHILIEANVGEGVVSAPLSKYFKYHTRLCRPVGLTDEDRDTVCKYAVERIGLAYDTKNIFDLLRYLIPLPVPQRWRRRMLSLGSGDPTRVICSALIAEAFGSVRYPILPKITQAGSRAARRQILEIRHSSLYAPRDFDISPYFEIIKPTIVAGFDYRKLHWADRAKPPREVAASSPFRKERKRFGLKSDAQDSALHSGAADNEAHAEPSPAHALPAKAVRAKVKNTKADHQTASRKMAGNKRARNINADKSYPENASA